MSNEVLINWAEFIFYFISQQTSIITLRSTPKSFPMERRGWFLLREKWIWKIRVGGTFRDSDEIVSIPYPYRYISWFFVAPRLWYWWMLPYPCPLLAGKPHRRHRKGKDKRSYSKSFTKNSLDLAFKRRWYAYTQRSFREEAHGRRSIEEVFADQQQQQLPPGITVLQVPSSAPVRLKESLWTARGSTPYVRGKSTQIRLHFLFSRSWSLKWKATELLQRPCRSEGTMLTTTPALIREMT